MQVILRISETELPNNCNENRLMILETFREAGSRCEISLFHWSDYLVF